MKHLSSLIRAAMVGCFVMSGMSSNAQTAITQIYTDFDGFWTSSTGANNSIHADSSHHLLAFTYGGTTYATGVNNAKLVLNGVTFDTLSLASFQIPAGSINAGAAGTYIGVGVNYGGVGNITPVPVVNDIPQYLTDGTQGLDLGTGVFNIPSSRVTYPVSGFNIGAIGDGIPDVILTQMGQPPSASVSDTLAFLDAGGNVLGNVVVGSVGAIPIVAQADWKFYNPTNPPTYENLGNPTRDLRMVGFDLSDFGLTLLNLVNIASFVHKVSGQSDQAFLAHNTASFASGTGVVLPVTLKSFDAVKVNGIARLNWVAVDADAFSHFEIERSIGNTNVFTTLDNVPLKSETSGEVKYIYEDKNPVTGTNFYRLKMVDRDNTFKYSNVKSLTFSGNDKIEVYPNPVSKILHINLPDAVTAIYLIGIDGREIKISLADIKRQNGIRVSALPVGMYTLRIISKNDIATRKFEVVH